MAGVLVSVDLYLTRADLYPTTPNAGERSAPAPESLLVKVTKTAREQLVGGTLGRTRITDGLARVLRLEMSCRSNRKPSPTS